MYFCRDCGKFFETPAKKSVWGYDESICPECESDFLSEAGMCILCGQPTCPDEEFCTACNGSVDNTIELAITHLTVQRNVSYMTAKKAIQSVMVNE